MQDDERYVIGLDSSTQSVKAIAWTPDGVPRAEGRAAHHILTPGPLLAEQHSDEWWTAAQAALRGLTAQISADRIDGLAISNQRETMVLLGADDRPLAPATVWLDRRAKDAVPLLAAEMGAERLHAISGKPVDVLVPVYRLRYLRKHEPHLLDAAARILSVHDFLTLKLTGEPAASWTSADPFGLFDIEKKDWSSELLDHLGIAVTKVPKAHRPGSQIGRVSAEAATLTGLQPGTPVFVAGGDGHCASLGSGATSAGTIYLNLGTAIVGGAWSPTLEISQSWRTLTSPTGDGYLLEIVQRGGSYFINWLVDNFAGGRGDPGVFARLEREASRLPVGSDGVTVCSYLVGCLDPHWDADARASFVGMGPDTGMGHLYRASLEAITLEFARALDQMRRAGVAAERIIAIGGGAQSSLWVRMIADATGLPVIRGLSNEASALGAGISAAVGVGWFTGFKEASAAMTKVAEQVDPALKLREVWQDLSARQAQVYLANRSPPAEPSRPSASLSGV